MRGSNPQDSPPSLTGRSPHPARLLGSSGSAFERVLWLTLAIAAVGVLAPLPNSVEALRYENRRLEGPVSLHVLRVDPKRHRLRVARALNDGVGRETVSSIARRHGALAAINGGFFAIGGRYDGDPTGVLKIRGDWFSDAPSARAVLGWKEDGSRTLIGRVGVSCQLRAGQRILPVDGLNRSRGRREAILYTWAFHRTTLTDPDGEEILVDVDGLVTARRSGGDSAIPPGGFAYSLGPDSEPPDASVLKVGARAAMHCRPQATSGGSNEEWSSLDYLVGGTPVLLEEGLPAAEISDEQLASRFVKERHPRTAVGVREDGTWVLVVVDGRQSDLSIGMTLLQMAGLLRELGCRTALNLDGGGSTTLFVDGRVVNSPSDFGVERPVSEAIVILDRPGTQ